MRNEEDPESGDRVTPVPEGDPEWPAQAWRESERQCWQEGPGDEED